MAERPLECGHCKKPVTVLYKEITGPTVSCTAMCADCPFLEKKLHGQLSASESPYSGQSSSLCCERCRTSLEGVKMGHPLGCSDCYTVFSEILVQELAATHQIPAHLQKMATSTKNPSLHLGHAPTECALLPPSHRLTTLNEALNEALKIENYEQAAWIRDQIKTLTEKSDEGKKSTP